MHCSKCEFSGFRKIKANEVSIVLDLENDEYIFTAHCSECNNKIVNIRRGRDI